MIKFKEIFRSVRPLLAWRGRSGQARARPAAAADSEKAAEPRLHTRSRLVLPRPQRREKIEWTPVLDSALIQQSFQHFREAMFQANSPRNAGWGQPRQYIWEMGRLTGERSYFYMQRWNEMGFLFEEAPKGWVMARAEKITSQSQFIRERLAWDHVMLYQAQNSSGLVRLSSDLMGESLVSLTLYEDFMIRTLCGEGQSSSRVTPSPDSSRRP